MNDINNQNALPNGSMIRFYKLIQALGRGAFGITYLALDTQRNRPVVLKEYFPSSAAIRTGQQPELMLLSADKRRDFDDGLRRFLREAQVLSEFDHPNVVKVIGLFDANDTAYLVMEHIDGQSLENMLALGGGRPFSEAQIDQNFLPVLHGLEAIHQKDLLHLDIKPDNILTSKFGEPLLIDFGGARYATSQASQNHSSMVATLGYAPPEQYSLKQLQTPASDIYAVGMTLFHLMAPRVPLPDSRERQSAVLERMPDPLPPIRQVAPGYQEPLYRMVEACTQIPKAWRPQSIGEVKSLLRGFGPRPQPPVGHPQPPPMSPASASVASGPARQGPASMAQPGVPPQQRPQPSAGQPRNPATGHMSQPVSQNVGQASDPSTQYGLLDPMLELAATDGVITEAEAAIILKQGKEYGLPEVGIKHYVSVIAQQKGWKLTWSAAAQPNAAQPNAAQPPVAQASAAQPPVAQASAAQPPVTQASAAQPSAAQPGTSKKEAVAILAGIIGVLALMLAVSGVWHYYSNKAEQKAAEAAEKQARLEQQRQEREARLEQERREAQKRSIWGGRFPLTITSQPAHADVFIMNIKPAYRDGILLAPGDYQILVRAPGYITVEKTIRIVNDPLVEHIRLYPVDANPNCIQGNCYDGKGVFRYDHGDLYTGQFVDGKRSKSGTSTWADDGSSWTGRWKDDKMVGEGTCVRSNGYSFKGRC